MRRHGERAFYFVPGRGLIVDPLVNVKHSFALTSDGFVQPSDVKSAQIAFAEPPFRFNWMFESRPYDEKELDGLVALGNIMNASGPGELGGGNADADDSTIPAGYTYLAQFIAHELSFTKSDNPLHSAATLQQERSPSLELDSLYGLGPRANQNPELYEPDLRLKVDLTAPDPDEPRRPPLENDLPRQLHVDAKGKHHPALIADPRNDENLPLAQTHLAFIKFHNKVLRDLSAQAPAGASPLDLFEQARKTVTRHFQWIVLHDFLPKIIDEDVLRAVLTGTTRDGRRHFQASKQADLYMPFEFAVAAFRLGHSMVRRTYDYNGFHKEEFPFVAATLIDFFNFTAFSGNLSKEPNLRLDWVIDWRRFYDFNAAGGFQKVKKVNMAKKIDTVFHLHLEQINRYPHNVEDKYKPITVRNLIRGSALQLPTGQRVAELLGETPMTTEMIVDGPHKEVLTHYGFHKQTPLWYYILKEAELLGHGNRLGPIGSRIVAETFVGILEHSDHSILRTPLVAPEMLPGRELNRFDMIDMLSYTDNVNPLNQD